MLELLRECEDNKILTAVYNNRNAYDSFSVGYVLVVTEEEMLLARISPRVEFDGYAVCRVDTIFRIETDGAYLRKVELLWKILVVAVPVDTPFIDEPLMDLLQFAADNHINTSICLEEGSCIIGGYVALSDQERVCVLQVEEFGRENGRTCFYPEEITRIAILDAEGQDLDMLYRYRKNGEK